MVTMMPGRARPQPRPLLVRVKDPIWTVDSSYPHKPSFKGLPPNSSCLECVMETARYNQRSVCLLLSPLTPLQWTLSTHCSIMLSLACDGGQAARRLSSFAALWKLLCWVLIFAANRIEWFACGVFLKKICKRSLKDEREMCSTAQKKEAEVK